MPIYEAPVITAIRFNSTSNFDSKMHQQDSDFKLYKTELSFDENIEKCSKSQYIIEKIESNPIKKTDVWGPLFKNREHFNEMHFC